MDGKHASPKQQTRGPPISEPLGVPLVVCRLQANLCGAAVGPKWSGPAAPATRPASNKRPETAASQLGWAAEQSWSPLATFGRLQRQLGATNRKRAAQSWEKGNFLLDGEIKSSDEVIEREIL